MTLTLANPADTCVKQAKSTLSRMRLARIRDRRVIFRTEIEVRADGLDADAGRMSLAAI